MADDISKVPPVCYCHGTDSPAEVDVPTIGRDEAFQRDYIPLGRSGWEIQTKGKGSTYRLCEPDGHRLAIPNEPYLHETLTRMARDVHADYATLARQLAEAKADAHDQRWQHAQELKRAAQAESQLAEATRRLGEVEGLVGKWRGIAHEYRYNPAAMPRTAHHYEACADELEQLTKEPTK